MPKTKADYRVVGLALKYALEDRCILTGRDQYQPRDPSDFFSLLVHLEAAGAWIWMPARLADYLGISRQAINNMIARNQLTTVTSTTIRHNLTFIILTPDLLEEMQAVISSPSTEDKAEPPKQNSASAPLLIERIQEAGYSIDEAKVLLAGFVLVRYAREEKSVYIVDEWQKGWYQHENSPFKTFTAADKALAEVLEHPKCICVSPASGEISNTGKSWEKLSKDGFDFYRNEGIIFGHGNPRIKSWSKGWGTWKKFESAPEVEAAWKELMKDVKALVG